MREESHLSDRDLLLAADGELHRAEKHVGACAVCRARQQELAEAAANFSRVHQERLDPQLPPIAPARASLAAKLADAGAENRTWVPQWPTLGACAAVLGLLLLFVLGREPKVVSVPNRTLTPGLAVPVSQQQICATEKAKNRIVPVVLRRRVFQEYGIPNAAPPAYEVDYLITPALGGADDIRNLWPQSYSSTVWNAQVKDALEDRLRDLVCDGKLDLATAQRDIAADWIGAYKKYFRTDRPATR